MVNGNMRDKFIRDYNENFNDILSFSEVTLEDQLKSLFIEDGIERTVDLIQSNPNSTLFFIGNGGSASISNHMAVDFLKNANRKAMSFSDSALLTCLSNDYGFEHTFEKSLEYFASKNDILFAISSSGQSQNIINGVRMAQKKQCHAITLSGFKPDNLLRSTGRINFYVPSSEYGTVEVIHQYIMHFITDTYIKSKEGNNKDDR